MSENSRPQDEVLGEEELEAAAGGQDEGCPYHSHGGVEFPPDPEDFPGKHK